jgi:tetratricopeptide (TPR) repeat protein
VELTETRTARIIWSEVLNHAADEALLALDEIGDRVVASVAAEIEAVERNRAILRPPSSLDAWEAHHRGLWHMYRFTREDNGRAQQFFRAAVKLDPTFARAWAGLSFTHWQSAFQGWAARKPEAEQAYAAAGQALMADDRDPAAHSSMGRALWLRGDVPQAISELQGAIELSPNFALAHYSLAFLHAQAGDPAAGIASADRAQRLSPFDPLLFAMYGSRAMAHARLGRFDEAARNAAIAASRPNAHPHIFGLAACEVGLDAAASTGPTRPGSSRR